LAESSFLKTIRGRLEQAPPVLFVLAAALMWSTIGTSYTLILDWFPELDSVSLFTVRAIGATVLLACWLAWRRPAALRPPRSALPAFALLGGSAVTGFYVVFGLAVEWSSVAVATVLLYLAPAIVGVGGALFLNERLTARNVVSIVLAFSGCILVVGLIGDVQDVTTKGMIAGLLSAITYASFTLIGKPVMGRYPMDMTLFYHLVFGSVGLLAVAIVWNGRIHASLPEILVITLFNGVFNTLLPVASYSYGMRRMRAASASTIATVEPVLAILLAWILLGETLGVLQVAGAGLVILAVILLARR
jgi:drug/metabolite transporter (DMT)-like permease